MENYQNYEPAENEKNYVHVAISSMYAEDFDPPIIRSYYPAFFYGTLQRTPGFKGTVIWDPVKRDRSTMPAVNVKSKDGLGCIDC